MPGARGFLPIQVRDAAAAGRESPPGDPERPAAGSGRRRRPQPPPGPDRDPGRRRAGRHGGHPLRRQPPDRLPPQVPPGSVTRDGRRRGKGVRRIQPRRHRVPRLRPLAARELRADPPGHGARMGRAPAGRPRRAARARPAAAPGPGARAAGPRRAPGVAGLHRLDARLGGRAQQQRAQPRRARAGLHPRLRLAAAPLHHHHPQPRVRPRRLQRQLLRARGRHQQQRGRRLGVRAHGARMEAAGLGQHPGAGGAHLGPPARPLRGELRSPHGHLVGVDAAGAPRAAHRSHGGVHDQALGLSAARWRHRREQRDLQQYMFSKTLSGAEPAAVCGPRCAPKVIPCCPRPAPSRPHPSSIAAPARTTCNFPQLFLAL